MRGTASTKSEIRRETGSIRSATPSDDWAVRELFGALHAYNASLEPRFALADGWEHVLDEHLAHERAAGHGITLLAWDRDTPRGLLMMDGHTDAPLFRHRHWAELLALYVVPEARGTTVAPQLLDAGLRWAREHGYARVRLFVTATNHRARRFYAAAGFCPIQEVWSLELGAAPGLSPDDPACEAAYAHSHNLLTSNPHLLTPGDEICEEGDPSGHQSDGNKVMTTEGSEVQR